MDDQTAPTFLGQSCWVVSGSMQRILLIVLLGLLPLSAGADGKVFSPTAFPAAVNIPDQRALIHFTNGVERLVIETRFTGAGTNFAWVVPLPSQPVVEAASVGLFPTLQYYFQSPITHNVTRFYLGVGLVIGLLLFLYYLIKSCSGPVAGVTIFLLLLLSAGLLLPALSTTKSKAGSSGAFEPPVSVLDRQLVGVFETTTIASPDPQALQTWLRDNGFVVTTNSEPIIGDYVKDGWVFVATKVRRDRAEEQTSTPHPLSFTFKTDRPVYPMRLTGVDNRLLQVELYVFADQRVYAPHFKVERCTKPEYPEPDSKFNWRPTEGVKVMHPLLRSWVVGAPIATKLTAKLTPEMMKKDVWLEGRDFNETRNRRFSETGASRVALNWSAGILLFGLVASYLFAVSTRPSDPKFSKPFQLTFVVSLLVGGIIYLALPKIDVRLAKRPWSDTRSNLYTPLQLVHGESVQEARRLLANPTNAPAAIEGWEKYAQNHYLGVLMHEEDSPGNFILREKDGEIEYVVFDAQGAESVMATWRPEQAE